MTRSRTKHVLPARSRAPEQIVPLRPGLVRPTVSSYPVVAEWRCYFFACPIFCSASALRTKSNTANPMHGGGVTLAVLCRDLCPALDLHGPTF